MLDRWKSGVESACIADQKEHGGNIRGMQSVSLVEVGYLGVLVLAALLPVM